MKLVALLKESFKGVKLSHFILPAMLTVFFISTPSTGHAITLPFNSYLNELTSELKTTARYLAILGIIIAAAGLFMGNAGDGVKKLLIIILAVSIAAYASTIVGDLFD